MYTHWLFSNIYYSPIWILPNYQILTNNLDDIGSQTVFRGYRKEPVAWKRLRKMITHCNFERWLFKLTIAAKERWDKKKFVKFCKNQLPMNIKNWKQEKVWEIPMPSIKKSSNTIWILPIYTKKVQRLSFKVIFKIFTVLS